MSRTYDPAKDAINKAKHGLTLEFGLAVLADPQRVEALDLRVDYGEDRIVAYGQVDGRVYVAVYTERDGEPRFISVRKANEREVRRYRAG